MIVIDERPADGLAPALPFPPVAPLADAGPAEKWPRQDDLLHDPRPWVQPPPGAALLPIVRRGDDVPVSGPASGTEPVSGAGTAAETRQRIRPAAAMRHLLAVPRHDDKVGKRRERQRQRRQWRMSDGDTIIAWAMAVTVAIVAVDAAIVSYTHIYDLATGRTGSGAETGIQARLLPLSIDGVIAEASLVLLYAARHRITPPPRLARCMLWLGIAATVGANVAHGLPSSLLGETARVIIGALLSAWPAGAFIGSVEMAMRLVRDVRAVATSDSDTGDTGVSSDASSDTVASDTEADAAGDSDAKDQDDPGDGSGSVKPMPEAPRRRKSGRKDAGGSDPVADAMRLHPGWSAARIAAHCGVSKRTVERRKKAGKA